MSPNPERGPGPSPESSGTNVYPGPTLACDPALRYLFHLDLDLGEEYAVEELLEDHLLGVQPELLLAVTT